LPPWGTIYRWFAAWRDDGRFERINHALVMADRERVGRRRERRGLKGLPAIPVQKATKETAEGEFFWSSSPQNVYLLPQNPNLCLE
jgi:transposase